MDQSFSELMMEMLREYGVSSPEMFNMPTQGRRIYVVKISEHAMTSIMVTEVFGDLTSEITISGLIGPSNVELIRHSLVKMNNEDDVFPFVLNREIDRVRSLLNKIVSKGTIIGMEETV